jgi:hypothetical protein
MSSFAMFGFDLIDKGPRFFFGLSSFDITDELRFFDHDLDHTILF